MVWKWCPDPGYWACGEEPPDLCDSPPPPGGIVPAGLGPDRWRNVGVEVLEDGVTYYVKCRPGGPGGQCDAVVETNSDVVSPWVVAWEFTTPDPVQPGEYDLLCKTGGGMRCQVALHPVEPGEKA